MATTTPTENGTSRDYKQREEVWFDDGREERLLEYVKARFNASSSSSSDSSSLDKAAAVIRLIDDFGINEKYMMNVGSRKGAIVTALVAEHKPHVMVELGSYVGYSTVLFAAAVRDNGGREYVSFERSPKFARVAASMVAMAGLADLVRFVIGPSSRRLVDEHRAGRLARADLVFLDHYKPAYVKDLKILESLGVVRAGSVLAADNVICPGNPTYLAYVRARPGEKQKWLAEGAQTASAGEFPEGTKHQYGDCEGDDIDMPGRPEIEYESRIVHSHEPTGEPDGVEITICKSVPCTLAE